MPLIPFIFMHSNFTIAVMNKRPTEMGKMLLIFIKDIFSSLSSITLI